MAGKRNAKPLSAGRPPNAGKPKASLSSHATRTLIRSHHQLNKQIETAKSKGNNAQVAVLQNRINELGGLRSYQQASIQGQATERGGDSSIVLIKWLEPVVPALKLSSRKIRMLEVGALSSTNACSRSSLFDVTRIDLNSQGDGILQQDFMQRPLPNDNTEKFDVISLSLVLNYVPDAAARGEMLQRTTQFLPTSHNLDLAAEVQAVCPSLFLVLPASCVTNSRYMDESRLVAIMASLGYALLQRKQTAKLIYYLWRWSGGLIEDRAKKAKYAKKEVNPGVSRNNFSIVLNAA
jgi:25S rRNA (adenine2142-N1)-methyltransferase